MYCPTCGAQVSPDLRFCPTCGAEQPQNLGGTVPPQIPGELGPPPAAARPFVPPAQASVETGKWIGEGWNAVTSDLGIFAVMALVYGVLIGVIPIILHAPMMAGFYIGSIKKLKRGVVEVGDLFQGFNYFVPSVVALILTGILSFIGMLFCIIPGLVIGAMYMFAILFIVDKKMDFWPAMQASHEVVKRNYVGFTLFFLAIALFNFLGLIALVVGLLVTVPVTFVAVTAAYRDLVGFEPNSEF